MSNKPAADSVPPFTPIRRVLPSDSPWSVSTHYFASFAKRRAEPPRSPRSASEPIVRKNDDLGNLTVVVNRYLPNLYGARGATTGRRAGKDGLTLVLAHCIAGHKEVRFFRFRSHLHQVLKQMSPTLSNVHRCGSRSSPVCSRSTKNKVQESSRKYGRSSLCTTATLPGSTGTLGWKVRSLLIYYSS